MDNRRSFALAWIVAGRLLLAAVAAAAAVFAFVSWHKYSSGGESQASYACPMHPEVTSSSPGTCPICRMALEPTRPAPHETTRGAAAAAALRLARVSPELRAFDAVSRVKRFETSLEMRAPAWLESAQVGVALLHRDQSQLVHSGEAAWFSPATGNGRNITVHASDQPPERWDDATDLVRFRVDPSAELSPNEHGWVKFATRIRRDLVIRASAVRESLQGPYVLVASNDRHLLSRRPVEIGSRLYDYAAVISGLTEGEYVVAKHAFALDTERRFGSVSP